MLGVFRWATPRVEGLLGMSPGEATRRRTRTAQSFTHLLTHSLMAFPCLRERRLYATLTKNLFRRDSLSGRA